MSHVDEVSADHPLALPSGTMLNEYRIDAVLGQGGFGITYLAFDTLLDEKVAIKEYFPGDNAMRTRDLSARARTARGQEVFRAGLAAFLDEARIIARFRHANVVQVRRFFEDRGTGYIVLNYEVGRSLEEMMVHAPLPEAGLLSIIQGILRGLEAVHERAVLHRDLKPRNVIVREDGTPVLLDFGAARDFGLRNSFTVTQIASSGYSPPEQYGIGDQHGPWSDLYALGGIAYRGVTGRVPVDSLSRIRDDPLVPAAKAAAGRYSGALLRAIDRMMQVDEAKRPMSVADVRTMLPALDRIAPMPLAAFPGHPVTEPVPHDWTRRAPRPAKPAAGSATRKGAIAAVLTAALTAALIAGIAAVYVLGRGNGLGTVSPREANAAYATPVPRAARAEGRDEGGPSPAPSAPHPGADDGAAATSASDDSGRPRAASAGRDGDGQPSSAPQTAAAPAPGGRQASALTSDPPATPGRGAGEAAASETHAALGEDRRDKPATPASDAPAAAPPRAPGADGPDPTGTGRGGFALSDDDADDTGVAYNPGSIPFLSPADRLHIALEQERGGETALALSLDGKYGVAAGQDTSDQARAQAMDRCLQAGGDDCQIYAADGKIVWPGLVPDGTTSLLTGLRPPATDPRPAAAAAKSVLAAHLHRHLAHLRPARTASCSPHCGRPAPSTHMVHHPRAPRSPPPPLTLSDYIAAAFGFNNQNPAPPRGRKH